MSKAFAQLLLKEKLITPQQYNSAIEANKGKNEHNVVPSLIKEKSISDQQILDYFGKKYNLAMVDLTKHVIADDVLKVLKPEMVKRFQVIPIQKTKGNLVVALADPTKLVHLDEVKFATGMNIESVITSITGFEAAIAKYYGQKIDYSDSLDDYNSAKKDKGDADTTSPGTGMGTFVVDLRETEGETKFREGDAPVIKFVNNLLIDSVRKGASDIHVEPYENTFRIRMRIDGVLKEIVKPPLKMKDAIISRLKIVAGLDISEKRLPQDGRIKMKHKDGEVDYRVSSMPTLFGEKLCLRLLNKESLQLDMTKLGFEKKQLESFKKGIMCPYGMVLVTGPTGSGKTTTLYSALMELNTIADNISTAEDPVEYNLEGINQVQMHSEIGLTFASSLKTFLRQDPDVIMVGEIRDLETAEIAIQAALTGHLVLSTLHTNDAPATVARLLNMGVEPFLIAASLNTIVAQRLVRRICPNCKEQIQVPIEALTRLGITQDSAMKMKIFKGKGCETCNGTGFKGRVAIYEVFTMTSSIKELILKEANALELKRAAIREGMKTLRMCALTKVAEGLTTLEEAIALTAEDH